MSVTYFDGLKKSFADVSTTPGVDTSAFLEASQGLVALFDLLGSSAFSVVQSDMNGNITKIRNRLLAAPDQSETLEQLVQSEGKSGGSGSKRPASQGLLWLLRGLEFTAVALRRSLDNASEELSVSFTKAYEATLRQYHSFVVRPVFSLAMKACPYRADFYAKLGQPQEKVLEQLAAWLKGLEVIVAQLKQFFEAGNWAKGF